MPENMGDEPAVVGEPVSQPHHAAVVGEPPEEMFPVLGEPVPLANGLEKDQQPISSSSHDAINGVHEESSPAADPPSQHSDSPSSTAAPVEIISPTMAEVHAASEEAGSEGETRIPIPSAAVTETSDAQAQDAPDVLDSSRNIHEAKDDAEIDADVEVTHIVDVPSEPTPPEREISTDNPFSALDDEYPDTGRKESVEDEEPAVADAPGRADEQIVAAEEEEEEAVKSLDASAVDSQGVLTRSPDAHEEATKSLSSAPTCLEEAPLLANEESITESEKKSADKADPEEEIDVEPPEKDTVINDSNLSGLSSKETEKGTPDFAKHPASAGDVEEESIEFSMSGGTCKEDVDAAAVVGADAKEGQVDHMTDRSTKSGTTLSEAEHVESREPEAVYGTGKEGVVVDASPEEGANLGASAETEPVVSGEVILPEALSNAKVSGEVVCDDRATSDKGISAKAFPMESGLQAADAIRRDPPPSDETSPGENGFRDGVPSDKEQPSSHFKVPVIAAVVIAAATVVFASIRRSRQ